MRNVIILGSGRSGTSMMAGLLAKVGYFMGGNLYPPDEGNPKGYFENIEINGINEDILAGVVSKKPRNIWRTLVASSRPRFWRWLAVIPPETKISSPDNISHRIKCLVGSTPFCFKDPRFCYTFPVWRPHLNEKEVVYIVIFRDPLTTAVSMVKEAERSHPDLYINVSKALKIWESMYTHILKIHFPQGENWMFFHYKQFLLGDKAFEKLEKVLGVSIDRDFPEIKLYRSKPANHAQVPASMTTIYKELCTLAGYEDTR